MAELPPVAGPSTRVLDWLRANDIDPGTVADNGSLCIEGVPGLAQRIVYDTPIGSGFGLGEVKRPLLISMEDFERGLPVPFTHERPGTLDRMVGKVEEFETYEVEDDAVPCDLIEANVITSELVDDEWAGEPRHAPVIDLDIPVSYVPSTTPGHGHLYVDHPMTEEQMWKLLDVMVEVGMVEPGFRDCSRERGYTCVRLPWVKKEPAA